MRSGFLLLALVLNSDVAVGQFHATSTPTQVCCNPCESHWVPVAKFDEELFSESCELVSQTKQLQISLPKVVLETPAGVELIIPAASFTTPKVRKKSKVTVQVTYTVERTHLCFPFISEWSESENILRVVFIGKDSRFYRIRFHFEESGLPDHCKKSTSIGDFKREYPSLYKRARKQSQKELQRLVTVYVFKKALRKKFGVK